LITSTVQPPAIPLLHLTVVKTNDANGDGVFNKTEDANGPGQTVAFRVLIENTSSVPVQIASLTDEWPGQAPFDLNAKCPNVIGTTLAAGGSVTCNFTVDNFSRRKAAR